MVPQSTPTDTLYINRVAAHIYHNDKKRLNMGKESKKTQKDW